MTEREEEPASEDDPGSYLRVAGFASEQLAGAACSQAQRLIFESPCDLSVYRMQFRKSWHVAVLGLQPPEDVDYRLETILAIGEAASLPDEVLQVLQERGARMRRRGPWSEGHYRSGPS